MKINEIFIKFFKANDIEYEQINDDVFCLTFRDAEKYSLINVIYLKLDENNKCIYVQSFLNMFIYEQSFVQILYACNLINLVLDEGNFELFSDNDNISYRNKFNFTTPLDEKQIRQMLDDTIFICGKYFELLKKLNNNECSLSEVARIIKQNR